MNDSIAKMLPIDRGLYRLYYGCCMHVFAYSVGKHACGFTFVRTSYTVLSLVPPKTFEGPYN